MPRCPGIGFVCLPGSIALTEEVAEACDLLEIEPQPFWRAAETAAGDPQLRGGEAALQRVRDIGLPILVHSVGCPVCGAERGERPEDGPLRYALSTLAPPWWSEHMSFLEAGSGARQRHLGFLLPPVQSPESIETFVGHIQAVQDRFGLPFAFETGVNYLKRRPEEVPDGAFWGEIAERADCGILLDLHNVWTNERNGRTPVEEVLAALPRERVWEMHLADGQRHKGYWLDAHSGLPPADLLQLAREVVPRLPELRAMVLEIIPDYIAAAEISAEQIAASLRELRAIAERSSSSQATEAASNGRAIATAPLRRSALPSPADWENAFAAALSGENGEGGSRDLASDPAIDIYRDLIAAMRRSALAGVLPLSLRYIWILHGEAEIERLFASFWDAHPPEPYPAREGANFAAFLRGRNLAPYLEDLTAIELARARAAALCETQQVPTDCDPNLLLDYIGNPTGRPAPPHAPCTAEVDPP